MPHNHKGIHHHHHATGNIRVAFFLNLTFTLIELVGGILTNSLAILSDAIHDFGDSLSLGTAWYFQHLSAKGKDKLFSYGYKRFSLLGAILNAVVLVVSSVFILSAAIPRIFHPEPVGTQGMIYLAVLGIAINGIAALRLKKGRSMNEKVVSLHLFEDVLGWVAVLIGAIVMKFWDVPWIDPVLSILISCWVLFNVYRNIKKSFTIILQGAPDNVDIDVVRKRLLEIEEVKDIHDCHLWSLDGEYNIFTVHLVLKANKSMKELAAVKQQVRKRLMDMAIQHITIEIEMEEEPCALEDC